MSLFLFKHRDGQTPLPPDYRRTLIPQNIKNFRELDEQEELNIALGLAWLEKQSGFPLDHLFWRDLHKRLFERVWTWAGKTRLIELENQSFLPMRHIQTSIRQLEGDAKEWFEGSNMEEGERVARFHERLLTIHPFPNGNGRFSRILTSPVCAHFELDLPTWGQGISDQPECRRRYIEAVEGARNTANYKALIDFTYG